MFLPSFSAVRPAPLPCSVRLGQFPSPAAAAAANRAHPGAETGGDGEKLHKTETPICKPEWWNFGAGGTRSKPGGVITGFGTAPIWKGGRSWTDEMERRSAGVVGSGRSAAVPSTP
ncbi:hypothetical protein CMUS01_04557 [Colletotrichum musicola]|uniref:Uncharacterized protein n=1 Tax=Colletotrichum musicola TaxID=2175873 RepID=A0A8H6KVW2_9PEZI|nr:hypothetical protein CMUS01_04557 [Colletotrichum musicola]